MAISRGVRFVALDGAVCGVDTGELYFFAEIVPALRAEEACAARNAWFNCYAVAWMWRQRSVFDLLGVTGAIYRVGVL